EILMFDMSVDAGLKPNFASYQRVILPFLALLTRKAISDCTLERYLNAIYSAVYIHRNDIEDRETNKTELINDDKNLFIPTS
ncbi:6934_t:CDS:2, partial [Diversispora eburnea]